MQNLIALLKDVVTECAQFVKQETEPLLSRLVALEAREVRDGKDGVDGKDGAPGPQGEKGERGEPGEKGGDGIAGSQGEPGVAGKDGAPGAQGPAGEKGERGDVGPQGPEGPQGPVGPAGTAGEKGERGESGEKGLPGPAGKDGASGPAGEKGDKGLDGRNGVDGLAIRPEVGIDVKRTYREGIWATYKGGLVRAMRDTDPLGEGSLEVAGWEVMVDGIADIEVAQSGYRKFSVRMARTSGEFAEQDFSLPVMIYRDVFKQGEDYFKGDVTTWAGSTWHAEVDHPKSAPGTPGSTEWKLIVKRGRDGKDGAPGKDGKDGKAK